MNLFLEKGYEKTTILDIVDHLGGLTRGAFYHHFKSKEEVFIALLDRIFQENNLFEEVKIETEINGLQKIKKVMINQNKMTYASLNAEIAFSLLDNPRLLSAVVENNTKRVIPCLCDLIEEGIADGSIQKNNAKLLSEAFMLIASFWFLPSIYPDTKKEFFEKILFVKNIFDNMGFPVFDEEVIASIENQIVS